MSQPSISPRVLSSGSVLRRLSSCSRPSNDQLTRRPKFVDQGQPSFRGANIYAVTLRIYTLSNRPYHVRVGSFGVSRIAVGNVHQRPDSVSISGFPSRGRKLFVARMRLGVLDGSIYAYTLVL